MSLALSQPRITPDKGHVIAKAVLRAGTALGLSQGDLAAIIGVSPATVSRMRKGDYALAGKAYELSLYLIRIFRSLDAISGGDDATMKGWIANANTDLGAPPAALIRDVQGLVGVMNYLDAARAPT